MLEINGSNRKRPAYYKVPSRSRSFWRAFRTITIWVVVITLLLVGAAVAYAWYTSQHDGDAKTSTSFIKPKPSLPKPHIPAPDAQLGVATQFLTTPVAPGDNASMSIHTNARARCTIAVKYGAVTATDSGLMPKVADDYGLAQWSWTIPATTPETKSGSVDVNCSNTKNTGRVLETLVIQKAGP